MMEESSRLMKVLAAASGLGHLDDLGVRGVHSLTQHLRSCGTISPQQERVINGQARAGDLDGAVKGMVRMWSKS